MSVHSACRAACPRRRAFLHACARGAALAVAAPALASLLGACGGAEHGAEDGGGSGALPTVPHSGDDVYSFPFAQYPTLQANGGALMANVVAASGSVPVAVVRTGTATAVALDATCTHQGCTVNGYDRTASTFTCACHGSVFTQSGAVAHGPATKPLKSFSAVVSATDISVTIP